MNYSVALSQLDSLPANDSSKLPGAPEVNCARASVAELLRIHEYERQRLGQELHDSTGQLVVSLSLSLACLRRLPGEWGQAPVIEEMQAIVGRIDEEIRSLAFLHYPAELADRCLSESIESLALGFARRSGLRVGFKYVGKALLVNEAVSIALLRVTQEALVNVHRHSHASSARVELRNKAGKIELRISDDGIGMLGTGDPAKTGGIGLQGMRYRVEASGGRFEIRNLNPGLMVLARVPIAA